MTGLMLAATRTSPVLTVIGLMLAVGVAFGLYALANHRQRKYGKPPWGIMPVAWGVVGFFLTLIAVVLFVIAWMTTSRRGAAEPDFVRPDSGPG